MSDRAEESVDFGVVHNHDNLFSDALKRNNVKIRQEKHRVVRLFFKYIWIMLSILLPAIVYVGFEYFQAEIIRERLSKNIALWSLEVEKSKQLTSLGFDEFSDDVIDGTPEEFKQLILDASRAYGLKASLMSAIADTESSFNPTAIYAPKAKREVLVYNKKTKKYKKEVEEYYLEKSGGLFQANMLAHDVKEEDVFDPVKNTYWASERMRDFIKYNKKRTNLFFFAMAHNSLGAAINGQKYIERKEFLGREAFFRGKFIYNYGFKIAAKARNQRMKEIYSELFQGILDFKKEKNDFLLFGAFIELNLVVPEMKLIEFNREDYRKYSS